MNWLKRLVHDEFPFLFAAPALLWQVYFLYVPIFVLVAYSFIAWGDTGAWFTLDNYKNLLNTSYLQVFINSFELAVFTVLMCLIIGYPVAHYLALKVKRFKTVFLVLLILPSWTSFIVQVYAWFFLLKEGGLVSSLAYYLGLTPTVQQLLNTPVGTFIGMVYCYLPFMIFPLFAVLERMDKRLIEASADLGANRFQTFRRIVFPLSLPGVAAGILLVFIPAFGEFAIPDLLGGGKQATVGGAIVDKFITFRHWGSGSALATLGVFLPIASLVLSYLVYKILMRGDLFAGFSSKKQRRRSHIRTLNG